jgi:subtilisin family serine protease
MRQQQLVHAHPIRMYHSKIYGTSGSIGPHAGNNKGGDSCTMSPASAPSTITVGASTDTDTLASMSNIGGCLSLFAPGKALQRFKGFKYKLSGCHIRNATRTASIDFGIASGMQRSKPANNRTWRALYAGVFIASASYREDSGEAWMSGTSMAAPHVAGAAALYLQVRHTVCGCCLELEYV